MMRFPERIARLIVNGRKSLLLKRFPPTKAIYTIQVGDKVLGRFRVKSYYRARLYDLTNDELRRACFRDHVELMKVAIRLGLWPECWIWDIELLDGARGARRLAKRGRPRPRHPRKSRKGGESHVRARFLVNKHDGR